MTSPSNFDCDGRFLYCPVDKIDHDTFDGLIYGRNLVIENVRLPHRDAVLARQLWTLECRGGRVAKVVPASEPFERKSLAWTRVDGKGGLLLPSLCHSHIHLDKCFILDKCDIFSDGGYEEAMMATDCVKALFQTEKADLLGRVQRLIRESQECGVTSMRAHVDVDTTVEFTCLEMALKLREEWNGTCEIQVAVFAQEPLFSIQKTTGVKTNLDLLKMAATYDGVSVVGSAPCVEPTMELAKLNIESLVDLAIKHDLHLDFHLDYNIEPDSEPLIYYVIEELRRARWTDRPVRGNRSRKQRQVTIGHATRLQLFTPAQWRDLEEAMDDLHIHIVGLPQSDMYMMGKSSGGKSLGAPRGTLRVPRLWRDYQVEIAMSVDGVENSFTPQGSLDPLSLCTLGVGLFQSATLRDARTLLRSVTIASKRAIGDEEIPLSLFPSKGDPADFVLLYNCDSVRKAVLNPGFERTTIRAGKVVARRLARRWNDQTVPAETIRIPPKPKIPKSWYKKLHWKYLLRPPRFVYEWTTHIYEKNVPPKFVPPSPSSEPGKSVSARHDDHDPSMFDATLYQRSTYVGTPDGSVPSIHYRRARNFRTAVYQRLGVSGKGITMPGRSRPRA